MLTLPTEWRRRLKAQITSEEGFRPQVYTDTRGKLTIGIGRCISTAGISLDEAEYLLDNDVSRCEKDVWHYCPWYADLDDARKVAILDMVFNMGINGLLGFHAMIECIGQADWKGVSQAMLDSAWANQVGARAKRLALIMETGLL